MSAAVGMKTTQLFKILVLMSLPLLNQGAIRIVDPFQDHIIRSTAAGRRSLEVELLGLAGLQVDSKPVLVGTSCTALVTAPPTSTSPVVVVSAGRSSPSGSETFARAPAPPARDCLQRETPMATERS